MRGSPGSPFPSMSSESILFVASHGCQLCGSRQTGRVFQQMCPRLYLCFNIKAYLVQLSSLLCCLVWTCLNSTLLFRESVHVLRYFNCLMSLRDLEGFYYVDVGTKWLKPGSLRDCVCACTNVTSFFCGRYNTLYNEKWLCPMFYWSVFSIFGFPAFGEDAKSTFVRR